MIKYIKCSEIIDVRDGTHDSPKYINGGGYPLVTSKNIKDNKIDFENVNYISIEDYIKINERSEVVSGDIIMPMIGTIGNPVLVNTNKKFAIKNVALFKLYNNEKVNSKFFYYVLKSENIINQLNKNRRGGTQSFVSLSNIRNLEIPIVDITEQIKIVGVLDKAQELINKRKEQIEALDELVKSKFIEMFGNPLTNTKGFPKIAIKEVIDTSILKAKKVYGEDEEISYIDISCIDNSINKIVSFNKFLFSEAPSRAQQCIQKGDILISTVRPNLKNIAMVQQVYDNMVTTSGVTVLRANKVNKHFLYKYVLSEYFTEEMVAVTSGANYPAIKPSDIYNHEMIYPAIELQNQFAEFVNQVDKLKFEFEKNSKEL